jgi:glycogen debranching enzyme
VDVDHLMVQMRLDASRGDQAVLLNVTPRLGFNRWVPEPNKIFEAASHRWQEWFNKIPAVLPEFQEQYYYAWWMMRAGLLSTRYYTTREVMTPSKSYYIGAWQWDNFFHALAYRHVDPRLAQDQLRILLDHQREDGMIPDAIHDEGTVTHLEFPVDADVTKPPLLAWAAWKLYEYDQDREFLDEVYGPILKWNNWWFEKNDLDRNGLCEYQHPFSSGLDDSPLWDDGMPVESPDLNTYLCLQQEALAKIAKEIGELEDSILWSERAEAMVRRLIQYRWDAQAGVFWATRHQRRVNVLTPLNLFPLITGRMPRPIVERLVQHLTDPGEFWTRFPVPSVALNDPKFNPLQMWRGPTWANINYLLIEGLFNSGYSDLARALRQKTLELLSIPKDFFEYYHPETGENPPKAAPIFGWSAAIYIDLAIQATREAQSGETR